MNYPKLLVTLQFGVIGLMILFSKGIIYSFTAILIFTAGLLLGLWAISHNRRENFHIRPELKEGCRLITTGAYRWIRHPMYSSVLLMMLGVVVSTPSPIEFLLFFTLLIILVLKAKREEQLWCLHDAAYMAYRGKTKLFIPYIL
jgi:protein-S-isoprenylcysteine O-methyltransferase Ste14